MNPYMNQAYGNAKKNKTTLIIILLVICFVAAIWFWGRTSGKNKRPKDRKYPNSGQGIPVGWLPNADVEVLYQAMHGSGSSWDMSWIGTDERAIFEIVKDRTPDQLAAIANAYSDKYNKDILEEFRAELSGDDLERVMAHFSAI